MRASTPSVHATHFRAQQYLAYGGEHSSNDVNLLVRFGIDSMQGRMVTRILIALVFFQPVYIAYGMDVETLAIQESVQEQGVGEDSDAEREVEAPLSEVEELATHAQNAVDSDVVEQDTLSESDAHAKESEHVTESSSESESAVEEAGSAEEEVDESSAESTVTDTVTEDDAEELAGENVPVDDLSTTEGEETEQDDVEESAEEGDSESKDTSDTSTDTEEVSEGDTATEVDDTEKNAEDGEQIEEDSMSDSEEEVLYETPRGDENKYVFADGDCTLVSEGEFYCVAQGPKRQSMKGDRTVYAEKDREGDREIYYFDGTEVMRITNNNYDDFAPTLDEETLRIVWQAMINDRLQIMTHDIPTNTTRQVTSSRNNSSNPSIAGDIVVWQEWVDTNWEVMMTDVDNNGQPFEIEQLTDNAVHDMFPIAYDGMVTWQSERGSAWEVVLYDIRTGKKHSMEKDDGGTKYENPRFVLLFDSKHDNGDVETIGYDLRTGDMMELGTRANPQPTVPVTPKDETPEAVVREATESSDVEVVTEDDTDTGLNDAPPSTESVDEYEESGEVVPPSTGAEVEGTVVLE